MATSWKVSDDGLTWTFQLREGVRFHDGTPCDADAVVFTFERLIVPNHPGVFDPLIPYAPDFATIAEVKAVAPLVVEFRLKEPSAVFEANLAMFPASIVSPTAVKRHGRSFGVNPVGTGPFKFVRWVRQQELVLEANAEHWRGRPQIDRVVFVPVKEPAVRVKQLDRGEIHLADDLPPAELDALASHPGIRLQEVPGINIGYLAINADKPPLDNLQVREAIWHAINKARFIDVCYAGHAQAALTPVPPTLWGSHPGLKDRAFDVAKAKALIEQAASEASFQLPLTLDLFVMATPRPYLQQPQEAAAFIKEQLRAIGLELRIVTSETSLHFKRLTGGEHQLALAGWSSDNTDPDNFLYQLLDSDNINDRGGNNICRYRNATVHELLLAAKRERDLDRRKELYFQAQEQIFADAPMVPLVHTTTRIAQRVELQGYRLHPTALAWLREAHFLRAAP
ncbi:MAG: ABC transporter substrate-binding protein [Pirellulales bacterium]|nr:ABC transporter substrate-binding protein [Pirellulales bacterium]